MKKIILSLIKMSSIIIILISFILLLITFINKSYFIGLGENYLKLKLNNKIEILDNKVDLFISDDTKIGKSLNKLKLTKKVNNLKGSIKEKTLNKTNDIINKIFTISIDDINNINIFGKDIKKEIKSIINNFILDIRIFLITNIIGFGIIYLLMFYRKRVDIIKNMFSIIVIIFSIMTYALIFYIIGQDWVTNIVTNNFIGYLYPFLIIIFILYFIYLLNKNISPENKKYIEEAQTGKFYWSIKDLKESKNVKTIKGIYRLFILIIDIFLNILFFHFDI